MLAICIVRPATSQQDVLICLRSGPNPRGCSDLYCHIRTMTFESIAKALAKCALLCCKISQGSAALCLGLMQLTAVHQRSHRVMQPQKTVQELHGGTLIESVQKQVYNHSW